MFFEPLIDFKQNHYGSWKYYLNTIRFYFLKFSSPKLLKHTITFFVTELFNIFIMQQHLLSPSDSD